MNVNTGDWMWWNYASPEESPVIAIGYILSSEDKDCLIFTPAGRQAVDDERLLSPFNIWWAKDIILLTIQLEVGDFDPTQDHLDFLELALPKVKAGAHSVMITDMEVLALRLGRYVHKS